MSHRASYISYSSDARDQADWNPEWSRRARGFPSYAAIRQLGVEGISGMIERCCTHARSLVMKIGRLPGAEVVWEPQINQGLVRFLDLKAGASQQDHDRRTDEMIGKINAAGEAFFSGTSWRGRRAMRVSVCNWQTTGEESSVRCEALLSALPRLKRPRPNSSRPLSPRLLSPSHLRMPFRV
jgi:glutamate/tyrosine decarboxylase-like PLP-dependent enzyme